jgi:hypothetical protein
VVVALLLLLLLLLLLHRGCGRGGGRCSWALPRLLLTRVVLLVARGCWHGCSWVYGCNRLLHHLELVLLRGEASRAAKGR